MIIKEGNIIIDYRKQRETGNYVMKVRVKDKLFFESLSYCRRDRRSMTYHFKTSDISYFINNLIKELKRKAKKID